MLFFLTYRSKKLYNLALIFSLSMIKSCNHDFRRRFKFIKLNIVQRMFDELPVGIYRHTAPTWVNEKMGKKTNKLNIPESEQWPKHIPPGHEDNPQAK